LKLLREKLSTLEENIQFQMNCKERRRLWMKWLNYRGIAISMWGWRRVRAAVSNSWTISIKKSGSERGSAINTFKSKCIHFVTRKPSIKIQDLVILSGVSWLKLTRSCARRPSDSKSISAKETSNCSDFPSKKSEGEVNTYWQR
jgi:hypothetical protein